MNQKRKAFLISFTGVDGSGKTTHAKSLVSYLAQRGYDCIYTWSMYRPILAYPFLAITKILGYWKEEEDASTDPLGYAPTSLRDGILGLIFRLLVFLDFQIKTIIKVRVNLIRQKIVVCDRYFYDILIGLMVSGRHSDSYRRLLESTIPKPQIAFLMDVPINAVMKRRNPPPSKLLEKRKAYLKLANPFNLILVDGCEDFRKNQFRIRREVMLRLEGFGLEPTAF